MSKRTIRLAVSLFCTSGLLLLAATSGAPAQQTVVIGSGAAPGVTVNEDVLRALDEPQGAGPSRLQFPGAAPADQPIRLRPPPGVFQQGAGRLTLRPPSSASASQFRLHQPTGRYLPVAPPLTAPVKPRPRLAAPVLSAPAQPKVARRAPPAQPVAPSAQVLSRPVKPELIVVPPAPKTTTPATAVRKTLPAAPPAPRVPKTPKVAKVAPPPPATPAPVRKPEPKKLTPPPPPPPAVTAPKPQQRAKVTAPPAPKIPAAPAPKIAPKAPPKAKAVPVPPPAVKQAPQTKTAQKPVDKKSSAQKQPAQKQAALTPPAAPSPSGPPGYGTLLTLTFSGGGSSLTGENKNQLSALANRLSGNTDRLQLKAYASAEAGSASAARRLSLSRALTVRSQLIAQGIRSTRIDVRALGLAESGAPDRVDVLLLKRP